MRRCTMRCTAPGDKARVPVTRAVKDSRLAPVALRIFATLSVPGHRSCPSWVRRFDLLNVVGSRPDFLARPEADNPFSVASASIARQMSSCFIVVIPMFHRGHPGLRAVPVQENTSPLRLYLPASRPIVLRIVANWNRKNTLFRCLPLYATYGLVN